MDVLPQIGFVHRGLEKLVETRDYNQFIYIAERSAASAPWDLPRLCLRPSSHSWAWRCPSALSICASYNELSVSTHHFLAWCRADAFGFESMFMHCWRFARARAGPVRRPPGDGFLPVVRWARVAVYVKNRSTEPDDVLGARRYQGRAYADHEHAVLYGHLLRPTGASHHHRGRAAALSMLVLARLPTADFTPVQAQRLAIGGLRSHTATEALLARGGVRAVWRCSSPSKIIIKEPGAEIPAGEHRGMGRAPADAPRRQRAGAAPRQSTTTRPQDGSKNLERTCVEPRQV